MGEFIKMIGPWWMLVFTVIGAIAMSRIFFFN